MRALRPADSLLLSSAALVAVNLVPLVGVVFLGWSLMAILVLYWVENGIIGALNVVRMSLAAAQPDPGQLTPRTTAQVVSQTASKGCLVPFFIFHYGIFWAVHGVFVFTLPSMVAPGSAPGSSALGGVSPDVVLAGALALAASHGVSLVTNYIGRGEYRATSVGAQMFAPYGRVVVLHLTILGGAFLVAELGAPVAALAVMVLVKTVIDLGAHLIEHLRLRSRLVVTAG